jgi:hypothetical protein
VGSRNGIVAEVDRLRRRCSERMSLDHESCNCYIVLVDHASDIPSTIGDLRRRGQSVHSSHRVGKRDEPGTVWYQRRSCSKLLVPGECDSHTSCTLSMGPRSLTGIVSFDEYETREELTCTPAVHQDPEVGRRRPNLDCRKVSYSPFVSSMR